MTDPRENMTLHVCDRGRRRELRDARVCSDCSLSFPATREYFEHARQKGGLTKRCRVCCRAERRRRYNAQREKYLMTKAEWRAANPEKVKEILAKWRRTHPDKVRAAVKSWAERNSERIAANNRRAVLRRLGLTVEEYAAILEAQNNTCAICSTPEPSGDGRRRNFPVDHCHSSKLVRGLLCNRCNMLIGLAKDDIDLLRNAADYLERNL